MALSWNEIKERAVQFSKEWEKESNEDAEAKSFMDDFFNVFGVPRRRVASFEISVKKEGGKQGFIDLLWKGVILIEFKSRGKDLDKAHKQATDYFPGLKDAELPKYILVSDFERFKLYDLDDNSDLGIENSNVIEFHLKDFVNYIQHFGFIAGYQKKTYKEQDPVNIKAADLMGKLHDRLKEIGYDGHPLEVYLVRLLFCLFAEDTTIFEKQQFQDFIDQRTNVDGSDLAARLQELFQVLNTPPDKRFKNLDEQLNAFPYVNGKLFEEQLPMASFDSKMRTALLECCYLDWSMISPAIFGSMFQSVMNPVERRNLGAHYTSEKNILKLIKPLFLDELYQEFESIKTNKNKLNEFHKKLGSLKFLDPACGCGNFLVITYRELRLLELEILRALNKAGQLALDVREIIWLDVDMMYGIEYEEFPARIAEVAMWLMDHQMNMLISNEFGQYFARLPLKKAATIVNGNALNIDWQSLLNPLNSISIHAEHVNIIKEPEIKYGTVNVFTKTSNELSINEFETQQSAENTIHFSYILGNPPFIGKHLQNESQKADMEKVFYGVNGSGVLDYVAAWYIKAAQLIQNTKTKVAFVSTNSISQGEQVGILWNLLFNKYKIKIHFAHRTFSWSNEAKGNAAVHVVIIGFANYNINSKLIFEYEDIKSEPHLIECRNINPYLNEGKDFALFSRETTICDVPKVVWGNKPVDGGHLIISDLELSEFISKEPNSLKFIKPLISAKEYLNGEKRWCLWLVDAKPEEIQLMPFVLERVKMVKKMREESIDEGARKLAERPTQFRDLKNPDSYILIPSTTSENRKYIPFAFFQKDNIPHNSCHIVPNANLFHFGVLSSIMHMAWVKSVCGRLESRFRYSKDIVYNNYPWPLNPDKKQIDSIEKAAQKVLDARTQFPESSLADLYDPLTMPPALVKAHNELDKAVDLAYRPQPFTTEANRMEFLFELYEKFTADLFTKVIPKKKQQK
ncbi:MAG: DNA methyltransferase [Bacteroidota bacterium]|nr:DNA methyltransferase [Bacteroidota bacterium]